MNEIHTCCQLKTGEKLTIRVLEPPLEEYTEQVEYWWGDIRERLMAGELTEHSLDRFFVGELNGEVVGSMTYATPRDTRDVGILGMVHTVPEHRRKGIGRNLLQSLIRRFVEDGGVALHLCTNNLPAFNLYRKAGFEPYTGDGMVFWKSGRTDFEATYFAPAGPAMVREAHWGDLARVAFLYNYPEPDWLVKDYPRRVFRDMRFESHFVRIMRKAEQGQGTFLVLENPSQRVVGTAHLTEVDSFYEQHVKVLDFRLCPAYFGQAKELLEALIEKAGELHTEVLEAYVAACDVGKAELLQAAGFAATATLPGHFALGNKRIDLVFYTRRLTERVSPVRQLGDYYGGRCIDPGSGEEP